VTGALKEQIIERLPWLLDDLGFRITYHDYIDKAMGSSEVELESDLLRVRFSYDGTGIGVEAASLSEPDRWFNLGFLWYALTGDKPQPSLEGWAWFVRDHLAELAEALGPKLPQTKVEFERRQQESREILARHCPPATLAGRIRRFKATPAGAMLMGPGGWMVAAALIVWEFLIR